MAAVNGQSRAESRAGVATSIPDAAGATGLEAAAFSVGLPTSTVTQDFLSGNGDISVNYGPDSDIFGIATMGGSNTEGGSSASRTMISSVTYAIDLNALTNPRQDLLVGLLDTHVEGTGFDTLNFEISREGVTVIDESFTVLADAIDYFENRSLNLGSLGVATVSGNLDLLFSFSLTTDDAGAGFYFDLIFGNSTEGSGGLTGDFDQNGVYECADIDALVAEIVAGTNTILFDLTGDGLVNIADLNTWRSVAGEAIFGPSRSFIIGDANLNGSVDVSDFNIWNANKFTSQAAWCSGDFNADGFVDVSDFNSWNAFKFTSSFVAAVPEPTSASGLLCAVLLVAVRRRKENCRR